MGLDFEHPQSFSKLFKTKTRLSPMEFRQSLIKNRVFQKVMFNLKELTYEMRCKSIVR
jgi:AraC-like DNA-binding protein